jgi:hypothetical protein
MKIKITFCFCLLWFGFWLGFYAGSHKHLTPALSPLQRNAERENSCWSKWSAPHDTSVNGWYREHGVVQYRTNLVTRLVEERNVR